MKFYFYYDNRKWFNLAIPFELQIIAENTIPESNHEAYEKGRESLSQKEQDKIKTNKDMLQRIYSKSGIKYPYALVAEGVMETDEPGSPSKISTFKRGNVTNQVYIPKHFENVILDEFVVMPDHIHGIIFI